MVLPGTPCATRLVTEVAIRQLKIKAVCKAFHANVGYDRRAIHSSGLLILNSNAKLPCHLAFCYVHLQVQLCIAHKRPDAAFVDQVLSGELVVRLGRLSMLRAVCLRGSVRVRPMQPRAWPSVGGTCLFDVIGRQERLTDRHLGTGVAYGLPT